MQIDFQECNHFCVRWTFTVTIFNIFCSFYKTKKPAFRKYDIKEGFNFQTTPSELSWENTKISLQPNCWQFVIWNNNFVSYFLKPYFKLFEIYNKAKLCNNKTAPVDREEPEQEHKSHNHNLLGLHLKHVSYNLYF